LLTLAQRGDSRTTNLSRHLTAVFTVEGIQMAPCSTGRLDVSKTPGSNWTETSGKTILSKSTVGVGLVVMMGAKIK